MCIIHENGYLLVCQPRNLVIEAEPCFALLLGKFELTFLILSDIRHINIAAKLLEHSILCVFDSRAECRYPSFQIVKRSLNLYIYRAQPNPQK